MDQDLIEGALDNLLQNSVKAMPEGGHLSVHSRRGEAAPETLIITINDTGIGMDARHLQRAFDDFFTTREDGSGLGLSFVKRVIEAHGGHVALSSEVGAGTCVTIELPYQPITPGLTS